MNRWFVGPWGFLFYVVCCIVPLSTALFIYQRQSASDALEEQFLWARKKAKLALERKVRGERFLSVHAKSDPYFLDKQIEALVFLKPEIEMLRGLVSHPAMRERSLLERKLAVFESAQNQLVFTEEKTVTGLLCKETFEVGRHPVELNEGDLKELLGLIEEIPASQTLRPQLIITDFHLCRKEGLLEMNMNLLKREFP